MDTEGAIRAQERAEMEEFWSTWIAEIEKVQVAVQRLTERVDAQDDALSNLEVDVESLRGEIKMLCQVDETNRKAASQQVTHLQHKIESALQDRQAAHQLLQRKINTVEKRVTGLESVQDSLPTMQEDLSSVQDVQI